MKIVVEKIDSGDLSMKQFDLSKKSRKLSKKILFNQFIPRLSWIISTTSKTWSYFDTTWQGFKKYPEGLQKAFIPGKDSITQGKH